MTRQDSWRSLFVEPVILGVHAACWEFEVWNQHPGCQLLVKHFLDSRSLIIGVILPKQRLLILIASRGRMPRGASLSSISSSFSHLIALKAVSAVVTSICAIGFVLRRLKCRVCHIHRNSFNVDPANFGGSSIFRCCISY